LTSSVTKSHSGAISRNTGLTKINTNKSEHFVTSTCMNVSEAAKMKICPFMSRPADPMVTDKLCEIHCIGERCMAWVNEYRTHEGTLPAHCRMLEFWAAIPRR
jgi:hypothetical protein